MLISDEWLDSHDCLLLNWSNLVKTSEYLKCFGWSRLSKDRGYSKIQRFGCFLSLLILFYMEYCFSFENVSKDPWFLQWKTRVPPRAGCLHSCSWLTHIPPAALNSSLSGCHTLRLAIPRPNAPLSRPGSAHPASDALLPEDPGQATQFPLCSALPFCTLPGPPHHGPSTDRLGWFLTSALKRI